jgi:hypothetical protein
MYLTVTIPAANRFARFERWRREVVPDLRMQMDVWGAEVYGIIAAADQALWAQEQQLLQLQQQSARGTSGSSQTGGSRVSDASSEHGIERQDAAEAAAALAMSMQGVLQDAVANVQRLYDKRYQQVEVSTIQQPQCRLHSKTSTQLENNNAETAMQ